MYKYFILLYIIELQKIEALVYVKTFCDLKSIYISTNLLSIIFVSKLMPVGNLFRN